MIVAEARAIIEERGENGLRVAELADRCNVAVGLLYHYFADRQAIIAEVRAYQYIELTRSDIDRVADTVEGHGSAGDLLDAALRSTTRSCGTASARSRNSPRGHWWHFSNRPRGTDWCAPTSRREQSLCWSRRFPSARCWPT
jgi:AcrR family transcriptional regulator